MKKSFLSGPLAGAAFLMATSAIGPGFITQTTRFTEQLGASFGFVILISVLLDIGAQLNIWRLIGVSKLYAQELANQVFPGAGHVLAALIVAGGLAFNMGNMAGAGLGLQVLTGCSVPVGVLISCIVATVIFSVKEAGLAMDWFAKVLGFLMIGLTAYVAISSSPPAGEAILKTVWPDQINELIILTIVGGTVGGYISFAGAHRLLDAGVSGVEQVKSISKGSVSAILIAAVMRSVLFLAALGVVSQGIALGADNPAASVFRHAAGALGYRLFGLVLWSAAITSVVGSAYTSISFVRASHPWIERNFRTIIIGFILLSTMIYLMIGQPVKVLLAAGAVNGFILPFALAIMLASSRKASIFKQYHHPRWLEWAGWVVVVMMTVMGVRGAMSLAG